MTTREFSDSFTVLLSSYATKAQFGDNVSGREVVLDEYEKSVFLTLAQEELCISLYSGKNSYGESFEYTEEMRRYLDGLIKSKTYSSSDALSTATGSGRRPLDSKHSKFFKLEDDVMFIVYEQITFEDCSLGCCDGTVVNVQPVTHDEYNKVKRNPFRGPSKYKAIRLDAGNGEVEIISKYHYASYLMRYLSRPSPIILEDLPDGLKIDDSNEEQTCQLNPALHQLILKRAVQMALESKGLYSR